MNLPLDHRSISMLHMIGRGYLFQTPQYVDYRDLVDRLPNLNIYHSGISSHSFGLDCLPVVTTMVNNVMVMHHQTTDSVYLVATSKLTRSFTGRVIVGNSYYWQSPAVDDYPLIDWEARKAVRFQDIDDFLAINATLT